MAPSTLVDMETTMLKDNTWWQNPLLPDFGKAGTPYAKSVRSVKALHGAKPDPGLLFDRQ